MAIVDIPAIANNAVDVAFDVFASIGRPVTFKGIPGSYNVADGVVGGSEGDTTVTGLISIFREMPGEVGSEKAQAGDYKVFLMRSELTEKAVQVVVDRTVSFDGQDWRIVDCREDPARSFVTLIVRRTTS